MKQLFLYILSALMLSSSMVMAQTNEYPDLTNEYPDTYEEFDPDEPEDMTISNVPVPVIDPSTGPIPCDPELQGESEYYICVKTYLNTMGEQLYGSVKGGQPPSPIYSWQAQECVLDTAAGKSDKCEDLEIVWQNWNERARNGELDFSQGATQTTDLDCTTVPESGWWMDYVYKCQNK